MDKYNVKLNKRAFKDIDSIFEYIALEKLSPENAKEQTDRIWKTLKTLDNFPQSHQERSVGRYAGKGYRQLIIDNYIAIFRIDENTKTVYIVTVQYQGRNL
jgi:plasmid stabilization system protein ParE